MAPAIGFLVLTEALLFRLAMLFCYAFVPALLDCSTIVAMFFAGIFDIIVSAICSLLSCSALFLKCSIS